MQQSLRTAVERFYEIFVFAWKSRTSKSILRTADLRLSALMSGFKFALPGCFNPKRLSDPF